MSDLACYRTDNLYVLESAKKRWLVCTNAGTLVRSTKTMKNAKAVTDAVQTLIDKHKPDLNDLKSDRSKPFVEAFVQFTNSLNL
jgi:ribonuclease HI